MYIDLEIIFIKFNKLIPKKVMNFVFIFITITLVRVCFGLNIYHKIWFIFKSVLNLD